MSIMQPERPEGGRVILCVAGKQAVSSPTSALPVHFQELQHTMLVSFTDLYSDDNRSLLYTMYGNI